MELNGFQNSIESLPAQWRHAIEKLIEEKVEERMKAFEDQYADALAKLKATPTGLKKIPKPSNDNLKIKKEDKKVEEEEPREGRISKIGGNKIK